jgi:hypothetical protein
MRPGLILVLGGPEVSHEWAEQDIVALADYLITGWGELSFPRLCRALLAGERPAEKCIVGEQPPLDRLALPYAEYSDSDLAQRHLYIETSRGCPFRCEFCLSALDRTAWPFPLPRILAALASLYARGARQFRFVDRTFNLSVAHAGAILEFFLAKLAAAPEQPLFLHFELVPDRLPAPLRTLILRFPPGVLQFEIGIQSFDPEVQARISRRQDNAATEANLSWLRQATQAHLHTDLIFGLPGETLASFAAGFDRLLALEPQEIQLGVLKRLRGTPILRHSAEWAMDYDPAPPYALRANRLLAAESVRDFSRLARYWDLLANSGKHPQGVALLLRAETAALPDSPFARFQQFSRWLWQQREQTGGFSPEDLTDLLFTWLSSEAGLDPALVRAALRADYLGSGARGHPRCLLGHLPKWQHPPRARHALSSRQAQHRDQAEGAGSSDHGAAQQQPGHGRDTEQGQHANPEAQQGQQ